MELLRSAAKGVRDVTREWEEYKKASLEEETLQKEAVAEGSDSEATADCSESEDTEDTFSLEALKNLTQSRDDLKNLISSRLPYKSIKHKFPSYGWKFFVERNMIIDNPFDEPIELTTNSSKCDTGRSRSEARSSSRQRKRRLSPAEIVERVSAPTYNSLTRNTIQIAGFSEKNVDVRAITPECEVCKRRNVE